MSQDAFLRSMANLLFEKKYQIAGQWKTVDRQGPSLLANVAVAAASWYVQSKFGGPGFDLPDSEGGAKAEKIAQAFAPLLPFADLIAYRYGCDVVLVIFADDLSSAEIVAQMKQIAANTAPVVKIGYRVGGHSSPTWFHPVVTFFDEAACRERSPDVLKYGWIKSVWGKYFVKAAVADVPSRKVIWTAQRGLASFGYSLGMKNEPIDSDDLAAVAREAGL